MSNNKKIVIGLIVVFLVVLVAITAVKVKKEQELLEARKNSNVETPNQNSEYQKVEIADLHYKIFRLDFDEKTTDTVKEGSNVLTSKIENGKVLLNYKVNSTTKEYEVPNMNNAYSAKIVYGVQGSGSAVVYISTTEGKLYKIVDDFANLDNVGNLIELKVKDVNEFAVGNLTLKDDAVASYPTVIIKTKDNKILTDDNNLVGNNTIVEVVEAKVNLDYNHETVKVPNLEKKLSKLDFKNTTNDVYSSKKSEPKLEVNVEQGYVAVLYTLKSGVEGYEVPNMTNAVSAKVTYSSQGKGAAVTYILTEDGKVFKLYDNFAELDKAGKLVQLNVKDAKSIAVGNMTLKDNAYVSYPTVIIKTIDNKVLTDDTNLSDGKSLVEVIDSTANYDKVEVSNLSTKLSKLDFENTTNDVYSGGESEPTLEVNVEQGYVAVLYTLKSDVKGYEVEGITNAVSARVDYSAQGNGAAVVYILTEDGKVYRIYDDFSNLNDLGNLVELNVNNAKSIAAGNITFKDDAPTSSPTVVIKTADNKVLTNDSNLSKDNLLVEVVNK